MPANAGTHKVVIQKSKAGCLTCKKRKVKCDQTKPMCQRCQKLNLRCSGYSHLFTAVVPKQRARDEDQVMSFDDLEVPIVDQVTPKDIPLVRPLPFEASQEEWLAYEYYWHEAMPAIAGHMDRGFWKDQVLQLVSINPTIRHAVLAVSNLFRHASECETTQSQICSCQYYKSAIEHYNKSIFHLRTPRTPDSDAEQDVPLITCALFTCMEAILGNYMQTLGLISQGVNMLSTVPESRRDISNSLPRLFQRLNLYCVQLRCPTATKDHGTEYCVPNHGTFDTLVDSRSSLFSILSETVTFINDPIWTWTQGTGIDGETKAHLDEKQDAIIHQLNTWDKQHYDLPIPCHTTESFHILHVYHTLARLWMVSLSTFDEHAYEVHRESFQDIISRASVILLEDSERLETIKAPYFNFEMGWIPPLSYTVLKCRDPVMRKQAVSLLSLVPKKEGLWDRAMMITVAKRVMELESNGRLFRNVEKGPVYHEEGVTKFRVTYTFSASEDRRIIRSRSEELILFEEP